jgi:DNA-binding ferritin-like protein
VATFNEEEIAMPAPLIVNFHMPIDAEDREVIAELQSMLVELIDLALIGKQAHWNV